MHVEPQKRLTFTVPFEQGETSAEFLPLLTGISSYESKLPTGNLVALTFEMKSVGHFSHCPYFAARSSGSLRTKCQLQNLIHGKDLQLTQ